jgi:GcrA cell cycle regulator
MSGTPWSAPDDARLAVLWAEGHTCAVLAREFGRSRNGIVGRVHRLHLPPRPSPIPGYVPAAPKPVAPKAVPPPVVVAPAPPTPPRLPSPRSCQYPFGDPGEPGFRFCEAPVWPATRYGCPHWQT